MVKGIGTDILAYDRIVHSLEDDAFLRAVYTEEEREKAAKSPDWRRFYFTRFAGKEAVFKSLGVHPDSIRLKDIEILPDENGKPCVNLYGNASRQASRREIKEILISLSWETEYALAVAVAQ